MTPETAQAWQQWWLRDLLDRLHASDALRARVLRLNPVVVTGQMIRGLYRHETIRACGFRCQVVTRADFEARWGKGSARKLWRWDRINAGGRRRWITAAAFERGPLPFA